MPSPNFRIYLQLSAYISWILLFLNIVFWLSSRSIQRQLASVKGDNIVWCTAIKYAYADAKPLLPSSLYTSYTILGFGYFEKLCMHPWLEFVLFISYLIEAPTDSLLEITGRGRNHFFREQHNWWPPNTGSVSTKKQTILGHFPDLEQLLCLFEASKNLSLSNTNIWKNVVMCSKKCCGVQLKSHCIYEQHVSYDLKEHFFSTSLFNKMPLLQTYT